jgi:hypothetical protein
MTSTPERPAPRFVGVDTYRDPKGRFSFRFPSDWYAFQLAEKREGTLYSPQAENPQTWFSAWATDLKEHVVAEDAHVLRQGVEQGLSQLAECTIEQSTDDVLNNLVKFERIFTFRDGEAIRKWRQWQLYVDHWLIVITYQGENPAEYDYWYAMVNQSFLHFTLPEALWFAVDRDLAGINRSQSPVAPEEYTDDEQDAETEE